MADVAAIRWIGGGSGAGKSTVALLLGDRHGVPVVQTDLSLRAHAEAMARRRRGWTRSSARRWTSAGSTGIRRRCARTFPWFAGDGFDLLLAELPAARPLIVEGFRLLPSLVAPLLGWRRAGGLAAPDAGAARQGLRGSGGGRVGRSGSGRRIRAGRSRTCSSGIGCSRDRLRAECEGLGLPAIEVDGSASVPRSLAGRVEEVLGLR